MLIYLNMNCLFLFVDGIEHRTVLKLWRFYSFEIQLNDKTETKQYSSLCFLSALSVLLINIFVGVKICFTFNIIIMGR